MLETTSFEEITQIRMSREIGGKPIYWVAAYLIGGLLIDTGCSYTDGEHSFTQLTNGQYTTENLVRSVLRMGEVR
jgi:hypothetical protein